MISSPLDRVCAFIRLKSFYSITHFPSVLFFLIESIIKSYWTDKSVKLYSDLGETDSCSARGNKEHALLC
jgi:hypothetical protein